MFTLDNKYSFEAEAKSCWLHTSVGYGENYLSWVLHLGSQSVITHFSSESALGSFCVHTKPPLGGISWRDLSGKNLIVPPEGLDYGFNFHCGMSAQWEDLIELRLRFGQTRSTEIEVFAEGRGSVEAAPDIFVGGGS